MILCNVPISLKNIKRELKGWIWDYQNLPNKSAKAKPALFTFVYFTYQPDFEFVSLSIQSLVRNVSLIADIYVFIDQKAPLTKEQENSLIQIYPNIKFYPVENFAWASIETTMTEVNSFLKVANESEPENYLVKVDSDILFLKGSKLARISISGLDTIGDYRHTEGQYYQGGLYFIKHKVIKQCFNHATADDFKQIAKQWKGNFAEDLAISQRLIDQGIKTNSTRLMLFPNEYQNLKHANKMVRWEFAALHFVKDKQNMQHYFDSFIN